MYEIFYVCRLPYSVSIKFWDIKNIILDLKIFSVYGQGTCYSDDPESDNGKTMSSRVTASSEEYENYSEQAPMMWAKESDFWL